MDSEKETLSLEERFVLVESGKRFCVSTFFVGLLKKLVNMFICKATLALVAFLYFVPLRNTGGDIDNTRVWCLVIFLVVFIFYECLVFILKNKTTVSFNASAGLTLSKNK